MSRDFVLKGPYASADLQHSRKHVICLLEVLGQTLSNLDVLNQNTDSLFREIQRNVLTEILLLTSENQAICTNMIFSHIT